MSGHFLVEIIHFYLCPVSRVLKDWKDWVNAWLCTLTELQAYVKKYYTHWADLEPRSWGGQSSG